MDVTWETARPVGRVGSPPCGGRTRAAIGGWRDYSCRGAEGQALTTDTLAELYDAYGLRLYRYALLILADAPAAEDAVQDTFVHLARALRRHAPPELSYAYMATAVRNQCFTTLRRRGRRREDAGVLVECESPGATEEERMILNGALAALPAEQREVIYLKVFEGLTFQEIADRCAISINTAGSRYRYAAAALRRALTPERHRT